VTASAAGSSGADAGHLHRAAGLTADMSGRVPRSCRAAARSAMCLMSSASSPDEDRPEHERRAHAHQSPDPGWPVARCRRTSLGGHLLWVFPRLGAPRIYALLSTDEWWTRQSVPTGASKLSVEEYAAFVVVAPTLVALTHPKIQDLGRISGSKSALAPRKVTKILNLAHINAAAPTQSKIRRPWCPEMAIW
jgi:hypothetical protein